MQYFLYTARLFFKAKVMVWWECLVVLPLLRVMVVLVLLLVVGLRCKREYVMCGGMHVVRVLYRAALKCWG